MHFKQFIMKKTFKFICVLVNICYSQFLLAQNDNVKDESAKTFIGHSDKVYAISFSHDSKYLVSGSEDNILMLWNIESGNCLKTLKGHSGSVNAVSFSPDGKYVISGSGDNTLKLWDLSSGMCLKTFNGHTELVNAVSYSPDGKYLISGSWDNTLKLWDVFSGLCIKTFSGHSKWVSALSYSPDGKFIVSGSYDATIKLWEIERGNCLKTFSGHSGRVMAVAYSPDEKYLLTGSTDNTLKIWDISSGTCVKTYKGHSSLVNAVSYSPDGKYVLSGSGDNTLKLWDVGSGNCIKTFSGHSKWVNAVSYSPDGKYVISASGDNTLKLWDIRDYLPLKQKIQVKVELAINEWQQKGKYEKTADYLVRVTEQKRAAKIKELQTQIITELGQSVFNKNRDFILGHYDADNESFLVKSNLFGNMLIKLPLNKAQAFEKDWDNVRLLNPQFSLDGDQIVITKMLFAHNADNYVFDISKEVKFNNLNIRYNFSKVELEPLANINKAANGGEQKQLTVGKSDIDLNIPTTSMINNNGIAIIIGNSNYTKTAKVDFALNDARLMKEYLIKTLGYKEGNILYYENIGLDEFNTIFGTKGNARCRLSNIVKQGISDVFIYYVGHGAPGINDGKGYFVPIGCDPNYVENGGYQLGVFYDNLSQIKAKSITVVTDACFSGADIFKNISPIGIKMKDPVAKVTNISVFSSSSGTEVSSWYNEKGHGMFTYFFLKAIQDKAHSDKNKDGQLTYQEIYDYLADNNEGVPYYARSIHNAQQNPTLEGDRNSQIFIKFDR